MKLRKLDEAILIVKYVASDIEVSDWERNSENLLYESADYIRRMAIATALIEDVSGYLALRIKKETLKKESHEQYRKDSCSPMSHPKATSRLAPQHLSTVHPEEM